MAAAKILAWIVVGLVVVVAAVVGAVYFGGGPLVKWALEHPVSTIEGRKIQVGDLTIDWGKVTRIVITDMNVANAPWGTAPDMFSVRRLEITVVSWSALGSLFGDAIQLPLIQADGAHLLLETDKNGTGNWSFLMKGAAPSNRGTFPELQRFAVRDSGFTYHNGVTGANADLGIAQLDLTAPDPASVIRIAAKGSFQKQPLHLAGSVGAVAALHDTEKPYPIDLAGGLGQTEFKIDGTAQHPLAFAGLDLRLALQGKQFEKFAGLFGVPLPPLPDFRGTTTITGGEGKYTLERIMLTLGQSDVEGGLGIDTTGRVPFLEAHLTSRYIDMANFKGLYGGTPAGSSAQRKPAPTGKVIPDTKIAIDKLPRLNVDFNFYATRIAAAGGLPFDGVTLSLLLKNGVLTLKPLRLHVADGDFALNVVYEPNPGRSPGLHGDINIEHIDLHKLLNNPSKPLMIRETAGIAGGFFKIDTTGTSPAEFLGRMNGQVGFFLQNGQLSDLLQQLAKLDVLKALGVYVTGDKPMPIECLVANFNVEKGVATASTFLLDTADTRITAQGKIDFADEKLDLLLTPANKHFTIGTLHTPFAVTGSFANPSFTPQKTPLALRAGAAAGLAIVFPPAALLPLIDTGLGKDNACATAAAKTPASAVRAAQPEHRPTPTRR